MNPTPTTVSQAKAAPPDHDNIERASTWLVRKTDARRATRIAGEDVDAMQQQFGLTDEESQDAHQSAEDELADRCHDDPLDIAEMQDREDRCAGLDAPWWRQP